MGPSTRMWGLTRTIGCEPLGQVAVSAIVQVRCVSTGSGPTS